MSEQGIYGFPCVSDPNDFTPDAESCSPEELAAHKRACETYGTPDYQPNRGCTTERSEDGQMVRHVLRTSWGIGVNILRCCDGCSEPVNAPTTCYDCGGGLDFCEVCWPKHAEECEVNR